MAVKKVPLSISISKTLLEKLREYLHGKEDNRSEVIERFIQEGLKREEKKGKA